MKAHPLLQTWGTGMLEDYRPEPSLCCPLACPMPGAAAVGKLTLFEPFEPEGPVLVVLVVPLPVVPLLVVPLLVVPLLLALVLMPLPMAEAT